MGDEVDLDEPRRRIVPVAERTYRNRTPYGRAQPRAAAATTAGNKAHLAQKPVHACWADRQQQGPDFGTDRKLTVALERRKQHRNERLETLRADAIRCFPQDDQRLADISIVSTRGTARLPPHRLVLRGQ
jgi:hypothetical protein